MKDYIYSIIEKQWWIFIIRFNDPRYISLDGTTAYLSTRTSSFDVSKFHLVCSIRADRQRQEAWITRVRSGRGFLVEIFTSSEHQDSQEDKRFSRKAPFISSFVFNPRILLDDNLPPPCPIRWRHEKSATDSSSDRFHFSSLTCLHLLVTIIEVHAKWSLEKWLIILNFVKKSCLNYWLSWFYYSRMDQKIYKYTMISW